MSSEEPKLTVEEIVQHAGWPREAAEEYVERMEYAEQITAEMPWLSPITAITIAGDRRSSDRAWQELENGMPFAKALVLVGSYTKCDFAYRAMEAGYVTMADLLPMWPDIWRGSDPDDTDVRFLEVWREAKKANGGLYVYDRDPLPAKKWFSAFRGQRLTDPFGFAWSLDHEVARKFAEHGGLRMQMEGTGVFRVRVRPTQVLGYLTRRQESEVVLDPRTISPEVLEILERVPIEG